MTDAAMSLVTNPTVLSAVTDLTTREAKTDEVSSTPKGDLEKGEASSAPTGEKKREMTCWERCCCITHSMMATIIGICAVVGIALALAGGFGAITFSAAVIGGMVTCFSISCILGIVYIVVYIKEGDLVARLNAQIDRLGGEIDRLGGEINRMTTQVDRLKVQAGRIEGSADRLEVVAGKNETTADLLKTSTDLILDEMENLGKEVTRLKGEVTKLEKVRDDIQKEVGSLKIRNKELDGSVTKLEKANGTLKDHLNELKLVEEWQKQNIKNVKEMTAKYQEQQEKMHAKQVELYNQQKTLEERELANIEREEAMIEEEKINDALDAKRDAENDERQKKLFKLQIENEEKQGRLLDRMLELGKGQITEASLKLIQDLRETEKKLQEKIRKLIEESEALKKAGRTRAETPLNSRVHSRAVSPRRSRRPSPGSPPDLT